MGVKMCFWMLLLLPTAGLAGPLENAKTELKQDEDFVEDQSLPGHVSSGGPANDTPSLLQPPLPEMPPAEENVQDPDTPQEVLAFQNVWNNDSGVVEQEFSQFGFCSQRDYEQHSQFASLLRQAQRKENDAPEFLHSQKEHWNVEGETFSLTLQFADPEKCYEQTTTVVLLFFIKSSNTDGLKIKFSSRHLHPNTQTVCVSQATHFLVLTGVQAESFTHENVKLRMEIQHDGDKKIGLAELQALMYWTKTRDKQSSPVILLLSEKFERENVLHANGTFLFLCELQKFLNQVSPQGNPLLAQHETRTLSPDALHSMPPLPLGVNSSESLLLELVNSTGPTVFYFPRQTSELTAHRVELDLNPELLSLLKFKLDQALAQVRTEQFGRDAMDTLRILSVLSGLPGDREAPDTGLENQGEIQYRAVLLLKALHAVLGAWAVERAQRAARDGQEDPRISHCHLESFTVSLEKFLLQPSTANIKNCEGKCGFPLLNSNNHGILLNSHLQSGQPLNRMICCVPVAYDKLDVIEVKNDDAIISFRPDMVAKECGCR